jgi:NTP pyrophosphatase (non-canonical NTP hydrolase)
METNEKHAADTPPHQNAGVTCDMTRGPCACGAWHDEKDRPQQQDAPNAAGEGRDAEQFAAEAEDAAVNGDYDVMRIKLAALTALAKSPQTSEQQDAGKGIRELSFPALRAANAERHVEWWNGPEAPSLSFRGNELAGEVGEACNVVKKLDRERMGMRGSRATKEQAAEEIADVIICADLIAMDLGIDLGDAVARKFNATSTKYELKTKL